MSAFLAHLAGIALGETARGAARPSLPPRYARPAASEVGFEEARIETPSVAPASAAERPPPADGQVADTAPAPPAAASPERGALPKSAAPPGRAGALRSRPPAAERQPAAPPRPAATAAMQSPIAPPASFPPESVAADPRSPPEPASLPPGKMWLAETERAPHAPPLPAPQATAPAVVVRERTSAPLSERALAGRIERPRQADPVIHVTIDRIDVRAPAVPRPAPAARRTPAEPSVSLSDFLRGGPRIRQ